MASRFISPTVDVGPGIKPASGAKLFFFETGTSTDKDTFTTAAANIANANPVIADSNGVFPDIFISGIYKVVLKDKNDVQVGFGEKDPVSETADITSVVIPFDNLADAISSKSIFEGAALNIKERNTNAGGGAIWDVVLKTSVTISSGAPANGEIVAATGDTSLALVLRMKDAIPTIFQIGVIPGSGASKTANTSAFIAALSIDSQDVIRVPFVDDVINVVGNIPITNGKRIVFDSEYMGEPLIADPDRGVIGDGTAPVFTTGEYPALSNTHRQIRIDNAKIRNTDFPCLELFHSDDAYLDHCTMITTNANALKGRFSARVEINGGHYLTSWAIKDLEVNFAITFYDNCNGLVISPSTIITGGSGGGGVDVTQSQKISVDGIYEVCGGHGIRIGGFSGDPNALWVTATVYKKGDEVKNTTNGYVAIVDHTSGATFVGDVANWKVINGNCNGVKFGGYFEQVQRPLSIGANNYCLGVTQGETYVGNTALPANGVPVPDFCIQLGIVVGFGYVGGVSYHKEGTEPTFDFLQVGSGGTFGDFLQDGVLEGHHVQGGGADFVNNITSTDNIGQIFGKNKIKLVRGGVTSGDRQVYLSGIITGTAGTGNDSFIFDTENGGFIDTVEVIEKSGTITSTLRIGFSGDTADNVTVDPETLSFNGNNAANVPLTSQLIRPNQTQVIRIIAGAGAGTFRVKINYRI